MACCRSVSQDTAGALTAIATLVAAVAGLLTALAQIGVITIHSPIVASTPTDGGAPGGQGPAIVYLDELTPLQQPGSWYQKGAKAVNGRDHARSVALRQPSRGVTATTVFNLGRHYAELRFTIGLWDGSDPPLQSKCQVFADQELIHDSGTMTRGRSTEVVRDVSDSFDLTFSCTPTQDVSMDGEVVFGDAARPGADDHHGLAARNRSCTTPPGGNHERSGPVRQHRPVGGQPVEAVAAPAAGGPDAGPAPGRPGRGPGRGARAPEGPPVRPASGPSSPRCSGSAPSPRRATATPGGCSPSSSPARPDGTRATSTAAAASAS